MGAIAFLMTNAFGMSGVFGLHVLFGAFALGSMTEGIVSIYYHEKGVSNG